MKGMTFTSVLLTSLLALSGAAIAQQSSPTESNSGIDSAQDVDPTPENASGGQLDKNETAPDSGVNSSADVDPTPESSGGQLEEDQMAPNSGIDSNEDVAPEEDEMNN